MLKMHAVIFCNSFFDSMLLGRCIGQVSLSQTLPKSQCLKIVNIYFLLTRYVCFMLDKTVFQIVYTLQPGQMKKPPWDNGTLSVCAGGKKRRGKSWTGSSSFCSGMTLVTLAHISPAKVSQMATLDFNKAVRFDSSKGGEAQVTWPNPNSAGWGYLVLPLEGQWIFWKIIHSTSWSYRSFVFCSYCHFPPISSLTLFLWVPGWRGYVPMIYILLGLLDLSSGFTKAQCWGVRHMCSWNQGSPWYFVAFAHIYSSRGDFTEEVF